MLNFFKKWRWIFLALVTISFFFVEIFDVHPGRPIHIFGLVIDLILIVVTGILVDILMRALERQDQMMRLLESKYKLNLVLTTHIEWQDLTMALAGFPSEITSADQSALFLKNPISQQFEAVSLWLASNDLAQDAQVENICTDCLEIDLRVKPGLKHYTTTQTGQTTQNYYCLPIPHGGDIIAFIQFKLTTGTTLSNSEKHIFEDLVTELAIVLMAGHDRARLTELRNIETALKEQHAEAKLLSSHFDQHIGQLRTKLDHLKNNPDLKLEEIRTELSQISDTAHASYEAIRNNLKATHPDTPQLNGLLHEYARKVAQQAGLILTFKAEGRQMPLESETQKAIYAVFQESFNNIEKHSKATKVAVFVGWAFDILTVSITDNGVGFDTSRNNGSHHLGLERMNDIIIALGGQIDLRSNAGEGSTITFIIPGLSERLRAPA